MNAVKTLQSLRLLPPPANELVSLLSTIAVFSAATLLLGLPDLQSRWSILVEPYSSEDLFIFGYFAIYMTMYWT